MNISGAIGVPTSHHWNGATTTYDVIYSGSIIYIHDVISKLVRNRKNCIRNAAVVGLSQCSICNISRIFGSIPAAGSQN